MAKFLIGIMVTAAALAAEGFCGMHLWNWFVPLLVPAAPTLSFGLAVGIGLVVRRFAPSGESQDLDKLIEDPDITQLNALYALFLNNIVTPFLSLFIGWIVCGLIT